MLILIYITLANIGFFTHSSESSDLVNWAKNDYPLDTTQKYVIVKNAEGNFGRGEYNIPSGSFYVIEILGESEAPMQHMGSGRKIGSTDVDLSKYEGQEVYIEGMHYIGKPMFLVDEHILPMFIRSNNQVVIHINSLKTDIDLNRTKERLKKLNR